MLTRINNKRRGDTLIEVLFAVTVFSLVAVSSLAIMNKGTATSQRALEITLVRQEIDSQSEALRFMHDSYVSAYQKGVIPPSTTPAGQWALMNATIGSTAASPFGATTVCPASPAGSFIVNTRRATFVAPSAGKLKAAPLFSKVQYDSGNGVISADGIWIEGVRSGTSIDPNQANAGYIDFHIRACWNSIGSSIPVTIGTIVRLYEPRG